MDVLTLTRNLGQTIVIGDNVRVKIDRVDGLQVRLSIDAPREVKVHRLEVFEAIKRKAKTDGK